MSPVIAEAIGVHGFQILIRLESAKVYQLNLTQLLQSTLDSVLRTGLLRRPGGNQISENLDFAGTRR